MEIKSILIAETTKEERERIVADSIGNKRDQYVFQGTL